MSRLVIFLAAGIACGQQLDLSVLDKLAARASESSTVTLDESKLKLASQFLSSEDPAQGKAKDLVSGLRAIFVRAFEFDKDGQYSQADLDPIRKQLTAPGWSNIVNVKERDESAEVWMFSKDGKLDGITVIAAESNELAVVNIVGPVDMKALASLAGSFGIPKIDTSLFGPQQKRKPRAETPRREKQDDEDE